MKRVVAQHFFRGSKFQGLLLLVLLLGCDLSLLLGFLALLLRNEFFRRIHVSSGFFEQDGEGLARAMQLAPDRIRRLLGEHAHLFIR